MGNRFSNLNERASVMNWKLFDAEMEELNPLRPSTRVRRNGLMMAVDTQRPHIRAYEVVRAPMPYDRFLDDRRKTEGIQREGVSWMPMHCRCGREITSKRLGMCKICAQRHNRKRRALLV